MKRIILIILVILFLATDALAFILGRSNLGLGGYPEFSGYRPSRPYSRESYITENYRSDMEMYLSEIEEYIDNAGNDIQRIQAAIEEAQNEASDAVDEFNSFIRGDY